MTMTLRMSRVGWIALLVMALCLAAIFWDGLAYLVELWGLKEEYSHAYLIPLIAAFLVWQKRDVLARQPFTGSWFGVALMLAGLFLFVVGELSTLFIIVQYAFLLTLFGAVLAYTGWKPVATVWTALFLLLFMVPLPDFIYVQISQKLQLLSSQIGVGVIRLFGISVYLEGNVIDLGSYKLQVVEACNGLRYLFPLMTLGVIVAVFFRAPVWMRIVVFLSTVPITVLMNSFRIGTIGVLVDRFGNEQAEGFLHDFEGWVVFMACFALLFVEMWLLLRLTGDKRPFRSVFAVDFPPPTNKQQPSQPRRLPAQAWIAVALLALAVAPAVLLPERVETVPERADFSEFPLQLADWSGRRERMDDVYVDVLKFSDYIMADYSRADSGPVNFYVAYYESQRKGESVHSPKTCIPGGGWAIERFDRQVVNGASVSGRPLSVNRVLIAHGSDKQLVYYWFQQRGRVITNEYLVKWFLFWDSLTRNRSDGSLVRLIAPIPPGGSEAQADGVLQEFARGISPVLARYIPD